MILHPAPFTRLLSALLIVLVVVAVDQMSKAWILYDIMNPPSILPLFPFLDIVLTWNPGVGFGLFKAHSLWGSAALVFLAMSISIALGVWLWRTKDKVLLLSLSMIIGGAIGNTIDRLRFGAVLDFIYVHVYIFGYHFPAFNIADSAITVGAALLLLESYVRNKE
ncbi:MAG: signal peptidase II [Proteobacteria bacterium]|nr:signal peptidase II [Pseudomonadota bacterium]